MRVISSIKGGMHANPSRNSSKLFPIKSFHRAITSRSGIQRRGQASLAEVPNYEHGEVFSTPEDIKQAQFPLPSTDHPSDLAQNPLDPHVKQTSMESEVAPLYYRDTKFDKEPYWQKIGRWKDITQEQFLSHRWNVRLLSLS
jgi:hypothetical protein